VAARLASSGAEATNVVKGEVNDEWCGRQPSDRIENPDRIISGSGRSSGKHDSRKLANRDLGRSCNPAKHRHFQATIQGYRQNGEKSGEIWLNPHR
jgi:hypothetical protein